ncbi:uncharacterized protein LOC144356660 [Saccoglossus kowalevskii]
MSELYDIHQRQQQAYQQMYANTFHGGLQLRTTHTGHPVRSDHVITGSPSGVAHRKISYLDADILAYLQKVKKYDINEIQRNYDVIVTSSKAGFMDVFETVPMATSGKINRACAALLKLYEDSKASLASYPENSIDIKTLPITVRDVLTIIDEINGRHEHLWVKDSLVGFHVVFYGTEGDVRRGKVDFIDTLRGYPLVKSLRDGPAVENIEGFGYSPIMHRATGSPLALSRINNNFHRDREPFSWKGISNGVVIKVIEYDITKDNADVIVCDIDENVQLSTSLSKHIVNVGGDVITCEISKLVRPNERLKVRSLVHAVGGQLPCRHVVFVVLPKSRDYSPLNCRELLFGSLLNVLEFAANYLKAKTVAFPCLATGSVHGLQVKAFCQTLLAAIDAFTTETFGMNNLREIRVVDLNYTKISILVDVFKSRYENTHHESVPADYLKRYNGGYSVAKPTDVFPIHRQNTETRDSYKDSLPQKPTMVSIGVPSTGMTNPQCHCQASSEREAASMVSNMSNR